MEDICGAIVSEGMVRDWLGAMTKQRHKQRVAFFIHTH